MAIKLEAITVNLEYARSVDSLVEKSMAKSFSLNKKSII